MILWELVTQEMPIRGALRPLHVPDECPAAIDTLITDCMAKDPAERPTADEVCLNPSCLGTPISPHLLLTAWPETPPRGPSSAGFLIIICWGSVRLDN